MSRKICVYASTQKLRTAGTGEGCRVLISRWTPVLVLLDRGLETDLEVEELDFGCLSEVWVKSVG